MVFQSFALLPWLTVQQNVELGLEARGVEPAQRARRALGAIDLIGLDGFESAYPKELSGGMLQRVGFARALVTEPDNCEASVPCATRLPTSRRASWSTTRSTRGRCRFQPDRST
jgi:ABC-type taurine transport system ATPase subunit